MSEDILLVVYGPQTNFDHLNSWSIKHFQRALQLECIEPVVIPDFCLNFSVPCRTNKQGVLTLTPLKGGITYGALVKTDREGYEVIRAKIEQQGNYTEQEISVIRANGVQVRVMTHLSLDINQNKFIEPNADYVSICEQGYSNLGLPAKQLMDAAMNLKPEKVNSIFVYGTLMRGQPNFNRINKRDLKVCLSGNVRGHLSSNGLFPALSLTGDKVVHGDFLQIRMDPKVIDRVLTITDELEGFLDFGAPNNLYTRTLVWVDIGAAALRPAWCYVQESRFDTVVHSGNWRMHREEYHEFQKSLIAKYAEKHTHFWERISSRHYAKNLRMAGKDQVSLTLSCLINLINDEQLYERDLAMAANYWTVF